MEALSQAKKIIEEAQKILVLTSNNPSVDALASALSLSYSLNDAGKIVNFFPKKIPGKYSSLFPEKTVPEKFLISIKNKEISELYYEKQNQILNIYLSSSKSEIKKDDLVFTPIKEETEEKKEFDLIVSLGVENLERLGNFYENNFKLFYQTPILNIDNKITNNKFGNINLVVEGSPISDILIKIIKSFDKKFSQNIRTWLLAGTINFSQKNELDSETMKSAVSLIKANINYEKIISFFLSPQKNSEAKLLEETLKNIDFIREKELLLALLKKEDFAKANASPKELVFVLKSLSNKVFRFSPFLLLWESPFSGLGIRGIFYSFSPKRNRKILENFSGDQKGRTVLFEPKELDLEKAKEKILEII